MINVATHDDIPCIVPLIVQMQKEGKYFGKLNAPKVINSLANCIDNGVVFFDEDSVLALMLTDSWYSDEQFLADLVFYVRPEKRTFRLFNDYVKMAKGVAKEIGVPLHLADVSGDDVERKMKLYQRVGLELTGSFYRAE